MPAFPSATTPRALLLAAALAVPAAASGQIQREDASVLVTRAESLRAVDEAPPAMPLVQRALPLLHEASELRLRALRVRCWAAVDADSDSLPAWANEGLAAAEASGDEIAIADLRGCRGYVLERAGNEIQALEDYEYGVDVGRRRGPAWMLADALVSRGELEYTRGDFRNSIRDLDESYRLYDSLHITKRVNYTLNAIANLYADRRVALYDKALQYYRQLLGVDSMRTDKRDLAVTYYNIGATLEHMDRFNESLTEFRRGLALDEAHHDAREVAEDRRAIGVVLYRMGRTRDALRELQSSVAFYTKAADTAGIARSRLNRGIALRMLGRNDAAIADLEFALSFFSRSGNRRYLEKVHEERSNAYAAAGRWHEAYDARMAQLNAQQQMESEAREEQTARLRAQFDAERQEAENRTLTRENAATARVRQLQLAVIVLAGIIIAALIALMTRQLLAARRLRTMAMVDELTLVANRRAIMQVAAEAARVARAGGPGFALLVLDIDHFKSINDTFGHEAGDRVLRDVAEACRAAIRPGDQIGRVGGEEFVVVLPGASGMAAREIGERLRLGVIERRYTDVSPTLSLTVSAGAAAWEPSDRSEDDVLRRADASLYEAKRTGRNRVLVAAG